LVSMKILRIVCIIIYNFPMDGWRLLDIDIKTNDISDEEAYLDDLNLPNRVIMDYNYGSSFPYLNIY